METMGNLAAPITYIYILSEIINFKLNFHAELLSDSTSQQVI